MQLPCLLGQVSEGGLAGLRPARYEPTRQACFFGAAPALRVTLSNLGGEFDGKLRSLSAGAGDANQSSFGTIFGVSGSPS